MNPLPPDPSPQSVQVLLVDDDPVDLAIVGAEIRAHGCSVRIAENAESAWEILQAGGVDICISDWSMPGMEGIELCRRAKALRGGGIPYFLLLTGHGDKQLHLKAIQAGADDVLQKSWESSALAARFAAALRVVALHRRIAELESQARK